MTDVEDLKLKAEIDDIMKSVDNIMQKGNFWLSDDVYNNAIELADED